MLLPLPSIQSGGSGDGKISVIGTPPPPPPTPRPPPQNSGANTSHYERPERPSKSRQTMLQSKEKADGSDRMGQAASNRLAPVLTHRLTDRLTVRLTDWPFDRHLNRLTDRSWKADFLGVAFVTDQPVDRRISAWWMIGGTRRTVASRCIAEAQNDIPMADWVSVSIRCPKGSNSKCRSDSFVGNG